VNRNKVYHLTWDLYYDGNPYFEFKKQVFDKIGGFSVSIDSSTDYRSSCIRLESHGIRSKANIHIIPMTNILGQYSYKNLIKEMTYWQTPIIVLGFKTIGRGAINHYSHKTIPEDVMDAFISDAKGKCRISFDTACSKEYKNVLDKHDVPKSYYYLDECVQSFYIDAVAQKAYPSSYHLDKSYSLENDDYGYIHLYQKIQKDFLEQKEGK
jgi:hypothetical protein